MNPAEPEKKGRGPHPLGFPDFGTSQWKEQAAQMRLSDERPSLGSASAMARLRTDIHERKAAIAAEKVAEEAKASYDQQHRRLRREAPPVVEPEPRKVSGRAVPAAEARTSHSRAIGARSAEEVSTTIPNVDNPPPARRDEPSPGRVSRRGVIGGAPGD